MGETGFTLGKLILLSVECLAGVRVGAVLVEAEMGDVVVDSARAPHAVDMRDFEEFFLVEVDRAFSEVDLCDHSWIVETTEEPVLAAHERVARIFDVKVEAVLEARRFTRVIGETDEMGVLVVAVLAADDKKVLICVLADSVRAA